MAENFAMLLLCVIATATCYLWIALDRGTDYVFYVYGRAFRLACNLKAWSVFASCGWRLAVIVGVVLANAWNASQQVATTADDRDLVTLIASIVTCVFSIGLVPWTFVMAACRRRRDLHATAALLGTTASRLARLAELSSELETADYDCEPGWEAWHPNQETWDSAGGQQLWSQVVPVVYASTNHPRTVVVPIDWSSFCVWGQPPTFARLNQLLPFTGPCRSQFRVNALPRRLSDECDCWVVSAEMVLEDET